MADRIGVMRDGRVVQFDKPDELYMHRKILSLLSFSVR